LLDLNFSILWALLEQREWDLQRDALEQVAMSDGGETWLFRFPAGLVDRLATLDAASATQAASRWAATEELNCPPEELVPVLQALVRLARNARSSGRELYLWGSL
jgi:hypothetical protein